jgi:hypothetical protein
MSIFRLCISTLVDFHRMEWGSSGLRFDMLGASTRAVRSAALLIT